MPTALQVACMCGLAMFLPLQVIVLSDLGRLFNIPRSKIAHYKLGPCLYPLDVNFNAGKEMEELKETRVEVKDSRFAEGVQDMQEAIQRAQIANQRGRVASSEEFDFLKEALNLQLGLALAMNHALREKETKFVYALGDNEVEVLSHCSSVHLQWASMMSQ